MEQYHELTNLFQIINKTIIKLTANTIFHIGRYLPQCPHEYSSLIDIIPIIWTHVFYIFFWSITFFIGFLIVVVSVVIPIFLVGFMVLFVVGICFTEDGCFGELKEVRRLERVGREGGNARRGGGMNKRDKDADDTYNEGKEEDIPAQINITVNSHVWTAHDYTEFSESEFSVYEPEEQSDTDTNIDTEYESQDRNEGDGESETDYEVLTYSRTYKDYRGRYYERAFMELK